MKKRVATSFVLPMRVDEVWGHLIDPSEWPNWARHMERVDMQPPGLLALKSRGTVHLKNGISPRFTVTEFVPREHWTWSGSVLGLRIHYLHAVVPETDSSTKVNFEVSTGGVLDPVLGWYFARIYRGLLGKAVPRLIRFLEGQNVQTPATGGERQTSAPKAVEE
jgi:Polyketide cyclase / dehydrase and lipid transport